MVGLALSLVLAPAGLRVSLVALRRMGAGAPGRGVAIAGVVVGAVRTLAAVVFVVALLVMSIAYTGG